MQQSLQVKKRSRHLGSLARCLTKVTLSLGEQRKVQTERNLTLDNFSHLRWRIAQLDFDRRSPCGLGPTASLNDVQGASFEWWVDKMQSVDISKTERKRRSGKPQKCQGLEKIDFFLCLKSAWGILQRMMDFFFFLNNKGQNQDWELKLFFYFKSLK